MSEPAVPARSLCDRVVTALDDLKAVDPRVIDVSARTPITDFMAFATGNSRRHVRSIADAVADVAREQGHRPDGIEGLDDSEWVLVDLGDVVVHVMLEDVRDFYRLERIWTVGDGQEA
jgi:ribosome-associated protein